MLTSSQREKAEEKLMTSSVPRAARGQEKNKKCMANSRLKSIPNCTGMKTHRKSIPNFIGMKSILKCRGTHSSLYTIAKTSNSDGQWLST